ncbi:MAG: o-succinylbenzoate synthase [Verrucomicrobia bacterium]|nr:o-succinylbenzoate synthase [Verrucomicrobiota bacterium]
MIEIKYQPYLRRFSRPLLTSRGEWAERRGFLLRVQEGERVGYGEVAPIPEFGTESHEAADFFLRELTKNPELVPGSDLPCCAFALSAARAQGFMGEEKPDHEYAVAGLLPAGKRAVTTLQNKMDAGFTSFKWKVGVESSTEEQAIFEYLMDGLPAVVRLRLDANGGWSREVMADWLEFLKPWRDRIEFVEQPLAPGAEPEMLAAREDSGIEIALDESLNGREGMRCMDAWPGVLVVKAPLMGEFGSLLERLRPLSERVVLSSVFETGVGLLNSLALADAMPSMNRALGFDTLQFSDGLEGRCDSAVIRASECAPGNAETIWKQNSHSS